MNTKMRIVRVVPKFDNGSQEAASLLPQIFLIFAMLAAIAGCSEAPVQKSAANEEISSAPAEPESPQSNFEKQHSEWRAEQLKSAPLITSVEEYFQAMEEGRPFIVSDLSDMEYQIVADKLRVQYPLISLRDRLAFEQRDGFLGGLPEKRRSEITGDPDYREGIWLVTRSDALKDLHSDEVGRFVRNDGFGVGRMGGDLDTKDLLKLPDEFGEIRQLPFDSRYLESRAVELPSAGYNFRGKPGQQRPPIIVNGLPVTELFEASHGYVAEEFADDEYSGWVKDIDNVAGFEPHRVRMDKAWDGRIGEGTVPPWLSPPQTDWHVNRLQLVSLLMHEKPVVYDSDKLPDMQTAGEFPVRELNEFERKALDRIRAGETVVIHSTQDRILMMGRIWANAECAQCHRIRDDEIMGAFSWELLRVPMADENEGPGI